MRITTLLALLSLHINGIAALYTSKGPVKLLTHKNFAAEVVDSDLPAIVEFFAPWCGHCKNLAPTYNKVAQNLKGIATVGAVDCDDAANKPLCGKYGVQGFPTLKLFAADKQKNPYTSKFNKSPEDYNGPRSAKAIADAVLAQLPDTFVTTIKSAADFEAFEGASALPKVVLASTKAKATPLYRSLSLRFKGRLAFATVRDTVADVAEALGISSFPALIVLPAHGGPVMFEGKLKAEELIAFLGEHAGDSGGGSKEGSGPAKGGKGGDQEGDDDKDKVVPQVVQEITMEDVQKLENEEDAWLLAFFQGDGCNATLAAFNKAVADLGPLIKAGQINITGGEAAAKAGGYGMHAPELSDSPCALLIALAPFDDKGDPADWARFTGDAGSAKELQRFALEAFPSFVTRVTGAGMRAFIGQDPMSPAVILFTDKEETPPVYAALSVNLRKYRYRFVDVRSDDAELMKQFNVKKVPFMTVTFLKPDTQLKPGEQAQLGMQPYPGPLKYPFMHSYLTAFAGMMGAAPEGMEEDELSSFLGGLGTKPGSGNAPADVPQAATTADLERLCTGRGGLCALALLDASDEGFQGQLGMFREAAGKWAKQPLHFCWVDAARQGTFLAGFGLTKASLPTAVTFSPKKLRGAQLHGAFSAKSIDTLIDGLFSGRVASSPFPELPPLVEGGEEDAPDEAPVEEEFDLADVLGEEVGGSGSKEELLKRVEQELEEEARRKEAEKAAAASAGSGKKKGKKRKKKAKAANEEL